MAVFSSTAEHFERLSRGLIPAVDLRLFWVSALAVCIPLQHMIRHSMRLENHFFTVTIQYEDVDGGV